MTLRPLTFYEIACDWPECKIRTEDLSGEYAAWREPSSALDEWTASDGLYDEKRDRHYCSEHATSVCQECFATDDLTEGEDGWQYCPTHLPAKEATP